MAKPNLSKFQEVLEALQHAQTMGAVAIANDPDLDDSPDEQDCYPRGIQLFLQRGDLRWSSLRFLAKHLDWVRLEGTPLRLHVLPPQPIRRRLTEVRFLDAVAESLKGSGIDCTTDINYR